MTGSTPRQWHDLSAAAERSGDLAGARALVDRGLAEHPHNPHLHNTAGSLAMRGGAPKEAESHFARALDLLPGHLEFAINRAIALSSLGQHDDAVALLLRFEKAGERLARYWSVRANAERSSRRLAEAQASYDRCLALEPRHAKALHGRARIALERGAADAPARFEAALEVAPATIDLWLGKAQALDVEGNAREARDIIERVLVQVPHWLDGLKFLAQLRLAAGEPDFASHYDRAERQRSDDPNIAFAHAEILGGLDHAAEAAEVAARARRRFPDRPAFALLEAVHAGSAGDDDRAEAIFSRLDLDTTERHLHEARHRLRLAQPDRAEDLLDRVLAKDPWNIGAWALRGIGWRLTDDPRAYWLHGQEGLVQRLALQGGEDLLARSVDSLRQLHGTCPLPLGQSLRGGTQTRGILFDRAEPVLAELRLALLDTIDAYRAGLPGRDATHPLLRHADSDLRLAGSWSVRLTGGGDYHTAHIHPEGILSSALYLIVPPDASGPQEHGWLEIGRPPPDLRLELPPLCAIEPEPGFLALFPSTLYHGTRPFGVAERMTVAFDVVPVRQADQ